MEPARGLDRVDIRRTKEIRDIRRCPGRPDKAFNPRDGDTRALERRARNFDVRELSSGLGVEDCVT